MGLSHRMMMRAYPEYRDGYDRAMGRLPSVKSNVKATIRERCMADLSPAEREQFKALERERRGGKVKPSEEETPASSAPESKEPESKPESSAPGSEPASSDFGDSNGAKRAARSRVREVAMTGLSTSERRQFKAIERSKRAGR